MKKTPVTLRTLLNTCEAVWIDRGGVRYHLINRDKLLKQVRPNWRFIYTYFNEDIGNFEGDEISFRVDLRRHVLYDTESATVAIEVEGLTYNVVFKIIRGATVQDFLGSKVA